MVPKGWATDTQSELLTSYIPLYETYQASTKQYQPFWDTINAVFIEKWPILPPGVTSESLNEDESKDYSKALSKLYNRIKEWYRWRCNSRSRTTSNTVTPKEMKDIYASGTRTAKEYEVFSRLNQGIFQPVYEAECIRQGVSGRSKLPIWHKVAAELLEKATEEQKAAVHAQIAADKEAETAEEQSPSTPNDYQKYWEKLPAILSKTVAPPVQRAGVLAFVTIVGPVPNVGGQILATTLQFGDKPETPLFSTTWADHDRVLVDQLATFAGRYEFPPELCSKRSLLHSQKTEDSPSASGSGQISANEPVSSAGESEGSSNLASNHADDLPVDAPPPESEPEKSIDGNADPYDLSTFTGDWLEDPAWADPNILETIISSNALDVVANNRTTASPFETATQHTQAHHTPALASPSNLYAPDLCPNIPQPVPTTPPTIDAPAVAPNSATPRSKPPALQAPPTFQISHTRPTVLAAFQQAPVSPDLGDDTPPSFGPNLPSHHAPVFGVSRTTSQPLQPLSDQPTLMPAAFHSPNITLSTTPTPSGPVPMPNAHTPPIIPPTVSATLGTVHSLDSNTPAAATYDSHTSNLSMPLSFLQPPSFTPSFGRFHTDKSKRQPPTDENAPPNTHVPRGVAGDGQRGKESDKRATAHAPPHDQDMENGTRRSRRAPVPSTHLDKLNEIGTNIIPPKPPVNPISDNKEPSWFAPAYNYLRQSTLGSAWIDLVEKWAQYERIQGWKSGKGLPAKGRPEEWQRWASKARHGIRNYNNVPIIEDAADLGIAVSTWVRSFSASDFCRTGPHGMVVLLMLMSWWGTAALRPLSWNTDSRPQWNTLLQDLFDQFNQLDSGSVTKRPREDSTLDENHENKCPRVNV